MSYYPGISEERERQGLKKELINVYVILSYVCLVLDLLLLLGVFVWRAQIFAACPMARLWFLLFLIIGAFGFVFFDSRANLLKKY